MASQNNPRYDANGYNSRGRRQIKGYSQKQNGMSPLNQAQQGANDLYSSGMKVGRDGSLVPLRNYGGTVAALSQQRNSLSPSGGGRPMNDMYLDDPTFFNRRPGGAEGFGQMLAQTREQRIAQSQREGTFDTIRDKYNQDNRASGSVMNKFGNIIARADQPQTMAGDRKVDRALIEKRGFGSPAGQESAPMQPAPSAMIQDPRIANRQALEQGAAGIKLQREATGILPTVTESNGIKRIEGKYGYGASTRVPSAGGEGMIGKQKFSEVMQGLANKPGVASEGDRFQPQTASATKTTPVKSAKDLMKSAPMRGPTKKPFTTYPAKTAKQMLA